MPQKSKTYAESFCVKALKKVDGKVFLIGDCKENEDVVVGYDQFTNPGKAVIKSKIEDNGLSFDRYVKFGKAEQAAIEDILDCSVGELVRVPLPEPDALCLGQPIAGNVSLVIHVNYTIDAASIPVKYTKLVLSLPAAQVFGEGIAVNTIVSGIASAEHGNYSESFFNAVGKVTCL